jgi:hypothetical protein
LKLNLLLNIHALLLLNQINILFASLNFIEQLL